MIEIKTAKYITCDDVEKLTGKHWGDFKFAQSIENDSYQILCCADWYLKELNEELKWEIGEENVNPEDFEYNYRAVRLINQIELVEILREDYGIRDSILIWVSW